MSTPARPTPKDPWPDDETVLPEQCDEALVVSYRRYREARDAGLSIVEARLFADSDADVGHLRKLRAGGCPPPMIAAILL